MINTIFFDNWNTLVEAPNLMIKGSSTKIFHNYITNQGIRVPYESMLEIYIPIAKSQEQVARSEGYREPDYRQRLEDVFKKLNINNAVKHSHGAWKYYLDMWPIQTEYFQGVPEMLNDLKRKYKLGVITNYMDGPTCRKVFSKLGYDSIFNTLVVSHEYGYMKPSKILFDAAMKETDSNPENCLMVGDSYDADIVGGNNAGMKTVLVDVYNKQQDYYNDCNAVIKKITILPDILNQLD